MVQQSHGSNVLLVLPACECVCMSKSASASCTLLFEQGCSVWSTLVVSEEDFLLMHTAAHRGQHFSIASALVIAPGGILLMSHLQQVC